MGYRGPDVTRRGFVAVAAVGTAALPVGALAVPSADPRIWDHECDVVICGSGAAGLTAAVIAASRKARVVLLEKADQIGGTTAKSGGAWWAPGNSFMRARGVPDLKEDALAFMARCSYPQFYDPGQVRFGVPEAGYNLLEAYFDNASAATDELIRLGALRVAPYQHAQAGLIPDYYSDLPENKAPFGRGLVPADTAGKPMISGAEFVSQLQAAARRMGVKFLLRHRVEDLVRDGPQVIGIRADHAGSIVKIRARQGVIFGTGGFTHNSDMARTYLRGPIFGGCAVPTNTGDIIPIATRANAALGNMTQGWWAQVVVEQAVEHTSVASDAFVLSGDGMILVNRFGKRIVNEKALYNERTQIQFQWDAAAAEYPNLLTYMIYDDLVAQNPGDWVNFPLPPAGFSAPYVISADTLDALAAAISERLQRIAGKAGVAARVSQQFALAPGFPTTLTQSVERFNGFARTGADLDFGRGKTRIEQVMPPAVPNGLPNSTMRPLAAKGPYHCIILGAGALDTKGGPVVDPNGRILDNDGTPIPGLYGAGNCIASPAAQAYWAGGATIGAAMAFAYAAARHVTGETGVEKQS